MQGLCSKASSGPHSVLGLPSHRAPFARSSVARRLTANWTPEHSEPSVRGVSSLAVYRPTSNASSAQNSLTAIIGGDGKSSAIRKLVVDGVEDSAVVQVKFCLKYRTSYGQSVKIIGSHPKLGFWDVNKALVLSWTEGDRWVASVELPAGSVYEYKYVLVDHDGRSALAWQGGGNSVLALGDQDDQGVEVQDNWGNNPGQAAVIANGKETTRENKLQAWANEMRQYRALARNAQYELTRKSEELQASKAQVARLKMELGLSQKARDEVEAKLDEVEKENLSLRAQVAQSQFAMKSTLEEAIKLLQQEIEEGEEELYTLEEELVPAASVSPRAPGAAASGPMGSSGSGSGAPSSSGVGGSNGGGGGWGWGRKASEPDVVHVNGNGNGNGTAFERFGFRLNGGGSSDQLVDSRSEALGESVPTYSGGHVLADWRTRLGGGQ